MSFDTPTAQYPSSVVADADVGVASNRESWGLNADIGTGDSSLTVDASTSGAPSAGILTINDERIKYTSKDDGTNTFSGLTRGFDGSTAAAHSAGDTVALQVTAHHHNALLEEVKAIQNELGASGSQTFVRTDGTEALTANWGVGGFDITNIGKAQGDTLEIINAGMGSNPTLTANAAGDQTDLSGDLSLGGTNLLLTQTTADYTVTWSDPAAARTLTIADPGGADNFLFRDETATVTNKTVDLGNNTVTGTLAEFNTAVSDATLVSLTGTETLTNKTLTSPAITNAGAGGDPTLSANAAGDQLDVSGDLSLGGTNLLLTQTTADYTVTWADPAAGRTLTINDPGGNDDFVFRADTATLTNKTISGGTLSGTTTYTNAGAGADPTLASNDAGQLLSLTGNLQTSGTLTVDGTSTLTGDVTAQAGAVFNEGGGANDFRVEGDTEPNLIFADASTDRVGIGASSPGDLLDLEDSRPTLRWTDTQTNGTTFSLAADVFGTTAVMNLGEPGVADGLCVVSNVGGGRLGVGLGANAPTTAVEAAGDVRLEVSGSSAGTALVVANNDSSRQTIQRDSSTLRHKGNVTPITPATVDPADVLAIHPIHYTRDGKDEVGFGAEHWSGIGLDDGLAYDSDGEVAGFLAGSRMIDAGQQVVLQDHEARIKALEEALSGAAA